MAKLKKAFLPAVSVALVLMMSLAGMLVNYVSGRGIEHSVFTIATGVIIMIMLSSFVKEAYFHKAALIIYLVVMVMLIIQIIVGDRQPYTFGRYLYIFPGYAIQTSLLMPLSYFYIAKIISKHTKKDFFDLVGIALLMLIPICLVFSQVYVLPVAIACFVSYITVAAMKKEKRISIPWVVFLIPVVLVAAGVFSIYREVPYMSERLEVIITRGEYDPYGAGWFRNLIDGILFNTPFVGATNFQTNEALTIVDMLSRSGDHNILILLAQYGWYAFVLAVAVYLLFFICLFSMVHKIRQSAFAKYTSLMFALFITAQAVFSLVGLFLLDRSPVDMPFMSGGLTFNIVNYISFAVILTLYLNRNKDSSVKELPPKNEEDNAFRRMIHKFINPPDEDLYYEEELDSEWDLSDNEAVAQKED